MFKKIIATALVFISLVTPLSVRAITNAQKATCDGAGFAGASVNCEDKELSDDQLGGGIKTVINILSVIVGAVSVIMIIIGGFRYVVSNGDSNSVSGAKNTILYAVVGLVIVLFAQILVRFILTGVTQKSS
jgi:hypothetical protein